MKEKKLTKKRYFQTQCGLIVTISVMNDGTCYLPCGCSFDSQRKALCQLRKKYGKLKYEYKSENYDGRKIIKEI